MHYQVRHATRTRLKAAVDVCMLHLTAGDESTALGTHAYMYSAGTAPKIMRLLLVPQLQLTWTSWGRVADAFTIVQGYVEHKGLQFTKT